MDGGLWPELDGGLSRLHCPESLCMVALTCTADRVWESEILSPWTCEVSCFHTESLLEKRNLVFVRTFILLSTYSANSILRHRLQRKLNILFSAIPVHLNCPYV